MCLPFSALFWTRAQQRKCRGLILKKITKMCISHGLVGVYLVNVIWSRSYTHALLYFYC